MRKHRPFAYFTTALVLAAFGACLLNGCGKRPTSAVVDRRDIVEQAKVSGSVVAPPIADARVATPYAAPVQKVDVTVGERVREGEVIAELSAPQSDLYYREARLRVQQARAALAREKSASDRQIAAARKAVQQARAAEKTAQAAQQLPPEEIAGAGPSVSTATARRQDAEQALASTQASAEASLVPLQRQVASAEQALQEAQTGRSAAMIRTPISGTVLRVYVKPGDVLDPGGKRIAARVVDLDALKVDASITDELAAKLPPRARATVTVDDLPGKQFTGRLENIYSRPTGRRGSIEHSASVAIVNKDGAVKPDMKADAWLILDQVSDVLAVPNDALFKSDDRWAVKVRAAKDKWRTRLVEIGISDGEYTQIESGLREGEVVSLNP